MHLEDAKPQSQQPTSTFYLQTHAYLRTMQPVFTSTLLLIRRTERTTHAAHASTHRRNRRHQLVCPPQPPTPSAVHPSKASRPQASEASNPASKQAIGKGPSVGWSASVLLPGLVKTRQKLQEWLRRGPLSHHRPVVVAMQLASSQSQPITTMENHPQVIISIERP
ncbi:hypothetical protein IF1G_01620 [Cordyceps javanica]|uniref:Uncharacterized protein n=1 Tax=Cordyceps javanica TaxID=43265 RepID=A0A545VCF0_9HYPO|nr:hypothetical protein IF1G_01620 [Cordyceps javanica]